MYFRMNLLKHLMLNDQYPMTVYYHMVQIIFRFRCKDKQQANTTLQYYIMSFEMKRNY